MPLTERQTGHRAHPTAHRRDAAADRAGYLHSTTNIYLHADMAQKERAIARVAPHNTKPGRYQPADTLLAFLEAL